MGVVGGESQFEVVPRSQIWERGRLRGEGKLRDR